MRKVSDKRKQAKRKMALYNKRLSLGVCPECGRRRDDGFIKCSSCRAKSEETQKRTRTKAQHNLYQVRMHRKRTREGLCSKCGQWAPTPGYIWCDICRAKAREHYRYRCATDLTYLDLKREICHRNTAKRSICVFCGWRRRRCDCGRFMKMAHSRTGCTWSCVCGRR